MKEALEARLSRIREIDAFLAVWLEILLGLAAVTTVVGLVLFLWYTVIRGHELWVIALCSAALGAMIGIPIGRFFMPSAVAYIRTLSLQMRSAKPPGSDKRRHSA